MQVSALAALPETPLAPDPVDRPALWLWLARRNLNFREAAPMIGCSHEHVRRVCLPYTDPDWRFPNQKLRQKVEALTRGEIPQDSWVRK